MSLYDFSFFQGRQTFLSSTPKLPLVSDGPHTLATERLENEH